MDVCCHTVSHTTAILELENVFVSVLERMMIRQMLSPNGVVLVKLFFSALWLVGFSEQLDVSADLRGTEPIRSHTTPA